MVKRTHQEDVVKFLLEVLFNIKGVASQRAQGKAAFLSQAQGKVNIALGEISQGDRAALLQVVEE